MDAVERIEIPTPFGIGRVNCYVFAGEELTLLDPGPKTDAAYEELQMFLEAEGYEIADVDRVLITHPHMDHYGLAGTIVEASGAEVVAHTDAVDRLADPDGHFDREQAFFQPFLVSMGVPEELVDTVVELPAPYTDFREPVTVSRDIKDGDRITAEAELDVVHTPGHAPGSVCYVANDAGTVFTGDHVMMDVSPNPLLTLRPGSDDERTRSLPAYLDSLGRIQQVEATVGYAGHREQIPDVPDRATEIIDHHHERKEAIAEMIADAGRRTAYDIMIELFPDLPATEMFPGMSEVIGHLDLLEDEGEVDVIREDGVRQYRLV